MKTWSRKCINLINIERAHNYHAIINYQSPCSDFILWHLKLISRPRAFRWCTRLPMYCKGLMLPIPYTIVYAVMKKRHLILSSVIELFLALSLIISKLNSAQHDTIYNILIYMSSPIAPSNLLSSLIEAL